MPAPVKAQLQERVGVIELCRPEKFNCLSAEVLDLIGAAVKDFKSGAARAILVRSQGKHFCTGADLDEVKQLRQDRGALMQFLERGQQTFRALEQSPLPVVAAVQGLALAGGLELMLACDVVFAAKSARFGDQHARYGLLPGWGGSQRLPRVVGLRRALDLFFSARWIEAEEALQWGLVNRLSDGAALHRDAFAYCRDLAGRSQAGLALMKRAAREGADMTLKDALSLEVELAGTGLLSADVSEGLAAFEARREPRFA
jgi:enoyl-CoA hydratase